MALVYTLDTRMLEAREQDVLYIVDLDGVA